MCLATRSKEPSVSNEDIICYKVLISVKGELITPYRDFCFPIGKVITDKVEPETKEFQEYLIIEGGYFHSCTDILNATRLQLLIKNITGRRDTVKIYKAVIPANTPYFTDGFGDICSKSLKIVEECCD